MGIPIYNRVTMPWFLVLIVLTGIGPVIAWRKASLASMRRSFAWPAAVGVAVMAALFALGTRGFYPLAFYGASFFVLSTISQEFWRGTRARMTISHEGFATALGRLVWRNKRRLRRLHRAPGRDPRRHRDHSSSAFKKEFTYEDVRPGAVLEADGYQVRYERIEAAEGEEYSRVTQYLRLSRGGRDLGPMVTESGFSGTSRTRPPRWPSTRAAATLARGPAAERRGRLPRADLDGPADGDRLLQDPYHALGDWLWLGGIVVIIGAHLAVLPDRRERA